MTPSVLITQEEADRLAYAWKAGCDEVIERMRQRLRELAPRIAAETDVVALQALLKTETDRAEAELIQLEKRLIEPREH